MGEVPTGSLMLAGTKILRHFIGYIWSIKVLFFSIVVRYTVTRMQDVAFAEDIWKDLRNKISLECIIFFFWRALVQNLGTWIRLCLFNFYKDNLKLYKIWSIFQKFYIKNILCSVIIIKNIFFLFFTDFIFLNLF